MELHEHFDIQSLFLCGCSRSVGGARIIGRLSAKAWAAVAMDSHDEVSSDLALVPNNQFEHSCIQIMNDRL